MASFDPNANAIFVTLSGSHAHGTARSDSDVDLRGACVVPLKVRLSYRDDFEQHDAPLEGELWNQVRAGLEKHPTAASAMATRVESVLFDLTKLVKLCVNANPNALEILFAEERDWVFVTPFWRRLHAERHRFLSAKVEQTYLGYALSQLKRIKTHRSWLLNPPAKGPTRADFGLPEQPTLSADDRNRIEQAIAEKTRSWGIDTLEMSKADRIALKARLTDFWSDVLACGEGDIDEHQRQVASEALGIPRPLLRALDSERKYRAARKHWESYLRWKEERNRDRAKLEADFGYDTKHAAHLVRLMRTGIEVLDTGDLRVRRPDAHELMKIRDGQYSYDELVAETECLEAAMKTAADSSMLPADVDHAALNELLFALLMEFYGRREAT
ncbi:MAG: nucleotidyltransferase domain-containing protein [Polyangiaceae bacterium]